MACKPGKGVKLNKVRLCVVDDEVCSKVIKLKCLSDSRAVVGD